MKTYSKIKKTLAVFETLPVWATLMVTDTPEYKTPNSARTSWRRAIKRENYSMRLIWRNGFLVVVKVPPIDVNSMYPQIILSEPAPVKPAESEF